MALRVWAACFSTSSNTGLVLQMLLISLALLKLFGLGGPRPRRIARDVVAEISTLESNFGLCDRALCTLRLKESLLFLSFPPQYLIQYWVTQMLRRDLLS